MNNAVKNIVGASLKSFVTGDGFTIHAESGEPFTGSGYLVGGIIPSLTVSADLAVGKLIEKVAEWYEGAEALNRHFGLVGGWVSEGVLHLDVVSVMKDEYAAKLLGRLWDQLAIGKLDGDEYTELALV